MGNRITKAVFHKAGGARNGEVTYTHYVRDASGNTMAVYKRQQTATNEGTLTDHLTLNEQHLYGSSRLGLRSLDNTLNSSTFESSGLNSFGEYQIGNKTAGGATTFARYRTNRPLGAKHYELSNHLGNVLATVSDRKLWNDDDTRIADVKSTSDYYPFGMNIGDRTMSLAGYRYGFNGKEKDPSGEWGSQAIYDYGFRIYNPGLGKFLSVDPLTGSYPWLSSYQFAGNSPIAHTDLDGLEYRIQIHSKYFSNLIIAEGVDKNEIFRAIELTREAMHANLFTMRAKGASTKKIEEANEIWGGPNASTIVFDPNLSDGDIVVEYVDNNSENKDAEPLFSYRIEKQKEERRGVFAEAFYVGIIKPWTKLNKPKQRETKGGIEFSLSYGLGREERHSRNAELGPNIDLLVAALGAVRAAANSGKSLSNSGYLPLGDEDALRAIVQTASQLKTALNSAKMTNSIVKGTINKIAPFTHEGDTIQCPTGDHIIIQGDSKDPNAIHPGNTVEPMPDKEYPDYNPDQG